MYRVPGWHLLDNESQTKLDNESQTKCCTCVLVPVVLYLVLPVGGDAVCGLVAVEGDDAGSSLENSGGPFRMILGVVYDCFVIFNRFCEMVLARILVGAGWWRLGSSTEKEGGAKETHHLFFFCSFAFAGLRWIGRLRKAMRRLEK